ncbi:MULTISPECIES: family 20 glycosylhydrolase [unclassified Enterococcus]|uniref:family 20 glycosylhydrolase n=1 Tax=unclassified Enterococcus TaxID=2608891 RepID=UPI003F2904A0
MKKVLLIDNGRKYFSKEQLIQNIKKASQCRYTAISFALGNNGLRFLLDDMTLTVKGKTYSSQSVKEALIAGTKQYYEDPNGTYLTETEMAELASVAKAENMEVIPLINTPGHMDAILTGMQQLGIEHPCYQTSIRTLDLDNQEAVAFTKALLEKYVSYFSTITNSFNIGCDECANDLTDGGWRGLQQSGKYRDFVTYTNQLAELVKTYGMIPIVFNDGIYYEEKEQFGRFDQDLVIAYWTAGWDNYHVSSAEFLLDQGHQVVNTNDHWYWVIGRKTSEQGHYSFDTAKNALATISTSTVVSNTELPVMGSMVGIWADEPQAEFVLADLFELLETTVKQ